MLFMQEILKNNIPVWNQCLETPFLQELQNGTLPFEKFKNYMIQDSIYLKHYARVYGKAIYHSKVLREIKLYYSILSFVTDTESMVRLHYLEKFEITDDEIEQMEPLTENQNYINFLLETAQKGDSCEILMAVLPCMLSYSYIFQKIVMMPGTSQSRYFDFIQDYAAAEYGEDCKRWIAFAEEKCKGLSDEKLEQLEIIFEKASFLELDFWKMGYREAL